MINLPADIYKIIIFIFVVLIFAQTANAKIYKWIDENGTIHFSDKPQVEDAKEIQIKETGIKVHMDSDSNETGETANEAPSPTNREAAERTPKIKKEHVISEKDYKITANVGELGADIISISGRIGSGPKCEKLVVTATAKSDTGLRATIVDTVRKSSSFGSVIFQGNAKASGSAEDYGFWNVEKVSISCEDN